MIVYEKKKQKVVWGLERHEAMTQPFPRSRHVVRIAHPCTEDAYASWLGQLHPTPTPGSLNQWVA